MHHIHHGMLMVVADGTWTLAYTDVCRHLDVAQSNASSRVDMIMHTEGANKKPYARPDQVLFYCIQRDPDGG